jgi:hypothetical protein
LGKKRKIKIAFLSAKLFLADENFVDESLSPM